METFLKSGKSVVCGNDRTLKVFKKIQARLNDSLQVSSRVLFVCLFLFIALVNCLHFIFQNQFGYLDLGIYNPQIIRQIYQVKLNVNMYQGNFLIFSFLIYRMQCMIAVIGIFYYNNNFNCKDKILGCQQYLVNLICDE